MTIQNYSDVADISPEAGQMASGQNGILFHAAHAAIFQSLCRALESHLPRHQVILTEKLPLAEQQEDNVRIQAVLLHTTDIDQLLDLADICRERFPAAAIGAVLNDVDCTEVSSEILSAHGILGLLPLGLRLDVWLAATSLLLTGGEYYPSSLPHRMNPGPIARSISSPGAPGRPQDIGQGKGLTNREQQILELISQGYQNKLIANHMSLSEHTVKVHVHNLIAKLRVTNRTQAAAVFRTMADDTSRPQVGLGGQAHGLR